MSTSRFWREIPRRYRLEGSKCEKCGKVYFPARLICPECRSASFAMVNLPNRGKVFARTVIRLSPQDWRLETPYAVAVIELENGSKIMAQVVDCEPEEVEIGQEVKLEFRRLKNDGPSGVIAYGYKAVPV